MANEKLVIQAGEGVDLGRESAAWAMARAFDFSTEHYSRQGGRQNLVVYVESSPSPGDRPLVGEVWFTSTRTLSVRVSRPMVTPDPGGQL